MKKVLLISALVLTFTVFMAAQAGSTSSTTPSGSASGQSGSMGSATSNPSQADQTMPDSSQTASTAAAGNENQNGKSAKIKGCLSKQGDNFFISDKKHPNGVQLDPGTQDLSAHVGHKVEVKGTWEAAPVSSASTSGAAGTTGGTTGVAAQAGTQTSGAASTSGSVSGNAGAAGTSGTVGAASETGSQAIKVDSFKHVADKCDMPADSNAPSTNPK